MQPWAEALTKERMTGAHAGERPDANCIPVGVPQSYTFPEPVKVIQEPDLVVILYEIFGTFRQIFLDGRTLPKDPNPTWLGYSVGRWAGDVLVVDTTGFNGKKWLDVMGHPTTDALHIIERFRPWTVTFLMQLLADTELLEYVCNENEKDLKHLLGK